MPTVCINGNSLEAPGGTRLSELLIALGMVVDHPCGGRGTCGKCTVTVNGKTELSCQYIIHEDVTVEVDASAVIHVPDDHRSVLPENVSGKPSLPSDGQDVLILDIGTTTMTLALGDMKTGRLARSVSANNPQRAFGADVMSRISYATGHGVDDLSRVLRAEINMLIDCISASPCPLLVAGNTTMLHLFLGVDPTPMGVAPYTPVFLEEKSLSPETCGLRGVSEVVTLPGFSAFVGADLVAGLHYVGLPATDRWRLLVDLGTNAEILLFNREKILCAAAAAGPCFEGACISSGMSASGGAICSYDFDGTYETVENLPPVGVCGTGLVDAVSVLLERGIVDETGYMEPPTFYLCDGVSLVQEDIRQYQLAKSAIHAAIRALIARAGITCGDIESLSIAGGFAATVDVQNAVRTGLLPEELADRCIPMGNGALLGTARYAADRADLTAYTRMAQYIDLAADPVFTDEFMERMMF